MDTLQALQAHVQLPLCMLQSSSHLLNGILVQAAAGGNLTVVELVVELLQMPRSPRAAAAESEMGEALCRAASGGHDDVVRLLLSAAVPPTRNGRNGCALVQAAAEGHEGVVRLLLQHPSAAWSVEQSALAHQVSLSRGHVMVERLLGSMLQAPVEAK